MADSHQVAGVRSRRAAADETSHRDGRKSYDSSMHGSLAGLIGKLDHDHTFHELTHEPDLPEGLAADSADVDPTLTVGIPNGARPALVAALAEHHPVVVVVASPR